MNEYGIKEIKSWYTSNGHWEMGWLFQAKQDFKIVGFRAYMPTQNITVKFWEGTTKVASSPLTTKTGEWVEVLLDNPLMVKAGKEYTISTYNSGDRYYCESSKVIFNDDFVTYKGGKYVSNEGYYPSGTESSYMYPFVDIIIGTFTGYYLLRNKESLFTITDGELVPLEETEVTAELFLQKGVLIETNIDVSEVLDLGNFDVLVWSKEDEADISGKLKGFVKDPQILLSDIYYKDSTIKGIQSCQVVADDNTNFAFSFDEGITWEVCIDNEWSIVVDETAGMSADAVGKISTDAFAAKFNDSWQIRAVMFDENAFITSITLLYLN